jgi:hypothetical protein
MTIENAAAAREVKRATFALAALSIGLLIAPRVT